MAIPLPKFSPLLHNPLHLIPATKQPLLFPASRSRIPGLKTRIRSAISVTKDDSLTSVATELDQNEIADDGWSSRHQQPSSGRLADRWREIHGCDDWAGLLDPIDPLLRQELTKYGEFAQACYDAFDYDPFSQYCGSCKYPRRHLLNSLGMADAGYEVTRYLYVTSSINLPNFFARSRSARVWSKRANWIGFVAVSGDYATRQLGRRDIAVAWRGTVTKLEWVADLMDFLRPVRSEGIPCPDPGAKVESGFVDLYTDKDPSCRFCKFSAREQVLTEVKRLVEMYTMAGEEVSVTMTGHSLGSALAKLSAYDVAETLGVAVPVCVFSFAGPRVGNWRFKERFEGVGVKALRVVNVHDTVPKVPGVLFNEHVPNFVRRVVDGFPWSYSHVGVQLVLDHKRSPFLKDIADPSAFHNLEALLHLLDGYHGSGHKFVLATARDPALVNKACDFLEDHHMVPPFWRQDKNKGMIRARDGRWVQPERQKIDDHPEDIHHHLQQMGLNSSSQ